MQERHIFFLFFHLGLGGIQRKIVDLVHELEKDPLVIPHIVVRRTEKFNFEDDLPTDFKQLHTENIFSSKEKKIKYVVFLIYLILEYNPKILVPFLHHTTGYCVLMKYLFFWKNIKVVVSQDNVLSFENQLAYSIKKHSNIVISWCYKLVDQIIVQTEFAKNDLVDNYGVKSEKIIVIQNWILDNKLYHSSKEYDLIYCGRFAPQKKLIQLLDVVKEVQSKIPNIKLCLIGQGPEKDKINKYIKRYGLQESVIIKPPTKEIVEELSKAKIFTLTSDFEGHPLAMLEAMMQQVVPVVLKYPGVEEYLNHKEDGYVELNSKHMAQRIVGLLQNEKNRCKIGNQARKEVLENHDKALLDKTLSVLLE